MTKPTARPALRLYVDQKLEPNQTIELTGDQAHYLFKVMRRSTGDQVGLFNGASGEYRAILEQKSKKAGMAHIDTLVLPAEKPDVSQLSLYIAPIKKGPMELVVRQATELGVTDLYPTITEHSQSDALRYDRLRAIALEACEQCERLEPPTIHPPSPLGQVTSHWPNGEVCFVAAEAGPSLSIRKALSGSERPTKLSILIGPEGGFSLNELRMLAQIEEFVMVGLGPRILKAETAAIAAVATVQAFWGDADDSPKFRGALA